MVLCNRLSLRFQPSREQALHVLMYMDDTVLLATTRAAMLSKITILYEFGNEYGMKVNLAKTKFFCDKRWCRRCRPITRE